jgi:hypothetical protein
VIMRKCLVSTFPNFTSVHVAHMSRHVAKCDSTEVGRSHRSPLRGKHDFLGDYDADEHHSL